MVKQFRTDQERTVILSPIEQEHVLKIDSKFSVITKSLYFDNYDLPCPILVEIATKNNTHDKIVLRKSRHGNVENEVKILLALKEFGLPVPEVMMAPFENEKGEKLAIYSLLPGENLQKMSMRGEPYLTQSKDLLIEAVLKLRDITDLAMSHPVSAIIPKQNLTAELNNINTDKNPWIDNKDFQKGLQEIQKRLENIDTPLILSNGDYQPGNFLAQNGKITGFLDFESAAFQDPLMGFVKYPIYDLRPLSRTNLIDHFLGVTGFTKKDFNTRLALGCLKTLAKEVPVFGGNSKIETYRNKILKLLDESLSS